MLAAPGPALSFLDTLDGEQRRAAALPFTDEAVRRAWTYLPGERRGVAMAELSRGQARAAHRLLASVLSPEAHAQVTTIMGLEDVLDEHEGGSGRRQAGDYWTAIFGGPSDTEPWAWRFEGHHVSVNATFVNGDLAPTPLFLGANPARLGATEPLAEEEALGFALVHVLDDGARRQACFAEEAPDDIVSGCRPRLGDPLQPLGVAAADLAPPAQTVMSDLLAVYVGRVRQEAARRAVGLDGVHFAYAGDMRPGRPHYYRLQGPDLLMELDNTQNGANHVHTVWRKPDGDFGDDLLVAHYAAAH